MTATVAKLIEFFFVAVILQVGVSNGKLLLDSIQVFSIVFMKYGKKSVFLKNTN